MGKMNQLKAGAILSYLLIGLGSLISLAYTPIMLRLLGQSEFGLYNLVASVVGYLGLLSFGFGSAYIRYFSIYKSKDDQEAIARLNGMFLLIFAVIGVIAVAAGMVLVYYTEGIFGSQLTAAELSKARILMAIMVLNIAITFPAIVFNSYVTANERFIFQKILLIAKVVVNPFVILPALIMGYGSIGMVVVSTVLNVLIEIINIWYSYRKVGIRFSFSGFDFKLLRELFVFSAFIFMNLLVNQINWNVDRFIIGRFHGTIEVAVYSVAAQLNAYYLQLSTAISGVYIPRVNALVSAQNGDEELSKLFTRLGRLQFILLSLILTGLLFFGRAFIQLWAGEDYDRSFPMALLLIIPATIPLIQNIGIEIQRAKNLHRFRSWTYLFIALGNIAISIPLTKIWGGVGAATGTAIALIIGNIFVMNWYYHKKVGINIILFFREILKILPALIFPVIVGFVIYWQMDLKKPLILLVGILIFTVVFGISMWNAGMNAYERELISKPLLSMKRKFKIK